MVRFIKAKKRGVIGNMYNEAFRGIVQNQEEPRRGENEWIEVKRKYGKSTQDKVFLLLLEFYKDSVIQSSECWTSVYHLIRSLDLTFGESFISISISTLKDKNIAAHFNYPYYVFKKK